MQNTAGACSIILYSEKDKPRVCDLFMAQVLAFKATGQIPFNWRWRLGYIYCFIVIAQTFLLAVLFLKSSYIMLLSGKLEEITDALTMTIIFWFSVYAACYWLLRWRRLMAFLELINQQYWHHSLPGLSFVSWQRTYLLAKRMTIVWTVACVLGTVLYGLAPLVMGVRALPLKAWYPFDPLVSYLSEKFTLFFIVRFSWFQQPYVYELVYVMQLSAQIIMGATFGNGSALYVSLVILMCGQFDVLYCSLKNLSHYARLRCCSGVEILRYVVVARLAYMFAICREVNNFQGRFILSLVRLEDRYQLTTSSAVRSFFTLLYLQSWRTGVIPRWISTLTLVLLLILVSRWTKLATTT